jgi:hypothetical protein
MYPLIYKGMVILPVLKKALHVHHWMIYMLILSFRLKYAYSDIIFGFSSVLTIQGLTYKDAFNIIEINPY